MLLLVLVLNKCDYYSYHCYYKCFFNTGKYDHVLAL